MRSGVFSLFGLAVAAVVWIAPWRAIDLQPFTVHMLRHITLITAVAPLLVAGSARRHARVSPLAATVVEFVVVWGWHLPPAHEAAATSFFVLALEQLCYLAAGVLLWSSVLRGGNPLAGAGGMLLTSMHMTLLGALLILAPRPLYTAVCFGAEPLADQHIGGMLMLAIGTPIYLFAGLWQVSRVLGDRSENTRSST